MNELNVNSNNKDDTPNTLSFEIPLDSVITIASLSLLLKQKTFITKISKSFSILELKISLYTHTYKLFLRSFGISKTISFWLLSKGTIKRSTSTIFSTVTFSFMHGYLPQLYIKLFDLKPTVCLPASFRLYYFIHLTKTCLKIELMIWKYNDIEN